MATSQQIAIREAVAALFAVATALAGGRIYQNRTYTLADGVASQIHVNLKESVPLADEMFTTHPIDWDTDIEVRIKARKSGADEADAVADAIWADAYSRLMADQSLGGLVQNMTPGGAEFDSDEADTSVASLTWLFTVRHRTSNDAIT